MKTILITGGAGFIGSAIVRRLVRKKYNIINIDKLTYASDLKNLKSIKNFKNYKFIKVDISKFYEIRKIFLKYKPQYIINCAAESHVDNSIKSSKPFIESNIIGTYNLLECIRIAINSSNTYRKSEFKIFHQISTDEIFGDSDDLKKPPDECSMYHPSSPYSASKASSDMLVMAWGRTFNIPYSISICTNNYGPYQYPEKLIPKTIINALKGKKIPVYGDGKQIRDWLYVEDHAKAVEKIIFNKKSNKNRFNISGNNKIKNIDLVKIICNYLDNNKKIKLSNNKKFINLIGFVKDRPGHDRMYILNSNKIKKRLNWKPSINFNQGLKQTIEWYLKNLDWWKNKV